jgi:hypothetical protein
MSRMHRPGQHPPVLWLWLMPPAVWCGHRLPVSIVAMVTSFLLLPQVGGSLSHICLVGSCLLGRPLVGEGISLRGSLFWGKSSSLSLLIFGTRGSMRLDKLWWYPHWVFDIFRKNTNMSLTPHNQTMSDDKLCDLTSMCEGIDIRWNCLHRAEAFWWYKAWLSQEASTGVVVCMSKPKASPESRLSAWALPPVGGPGRLECEHKCLTK